MAKPPIEATIFAYQVGFGDCFLLRFTYEGQKRRHILIDFGTTGLPPGAEKVHMLNVARDISAKCKQQGGRLDAVVATHRHADHISGFATADGNGSGDVIAALKPKVVVQPWTEAPDAAIDSLGPEASDRQGIRRRRNSLDAMHRTAELALKFATDPKSRLPLALANEMAFIGEDNIKNKSAVLNLQTMGPNVYVYHGGESGLKKVLPGVEVLVLGPPTLRQTDSIRKQKSSDKDEFWMLAPKRMSEATDLASTRPLFPGARTAPGGKLYTEQRWLARRIDDVNSELALSIVRALDSQMNNTSVILLFRAGNKSLLFPGDAQLENWQYALQSDFAALLDDVDVYKVGHHGSRNATPRSLWNRFSKKGAKTRKDRLTSVMSTKHGKHGNETKHTEVPRQSLVDALKAESTLHSTEELDPLKLYDEIRIPLI